jgi:predicted amidohydrolase YtcJ
MNLLFALLGLVLAAPPADLIVIGSTKPQSDATVEALIVGKGKIVAVVPQKKHRAYLGKNTVVVHADLITPGLVDAHCHPAGLGRKLTTLDLSGTSSYDEVLKRIEGAKKEDWLTGRGWDQNDWPDPPKGIWPTAVDLDQVTTGPTALRRIDGHAVWVNSEVLKMAGIDASTPDPKGGQIIRHVDTNEPTGVLLDTAAGLIPSPSLSHAEREANLKNGLAVIASKGLTGVHTMGVSDETLKIYEELNDGGALPVRVWVYLQPEANATKRLLESGPWGKEHLQVIGIKAFADGALGSRGAWLRDDYSDQPGHRGTPIHSLEYLTELASQALKVEAQVAAHAIGDQGVKTVLDAFAAARKQNPGQDHIPLRLEHAQVIHPDDMDRFAELNVIASMQPSHATSDMPWAEARLGPERTTWAYAWRELTERGATLAFGSDFPVEAVDPAIGLWAAWTRQDLEGNPAGGWYPDQKLTFDEAIAAFTTGAATAVMAPLGTLEPGAPADISLWSMSNLHGQLRLRATATIVEGALVWHELSGG